MIQIFDPSAYLDAHRGETESTMNSAPATAFLSIMSLAFVACSRAVVPAQPQKGKHRPADEIRYRRNRSRLYHGRRTVCAVPGHSPTW